MFIRLKNNGDEKNIIISSIAIFTPTSDGGSEIVLIEGSTFTVVESNRAIRSAIKKAYTPVADSSED